MTGIKNEEKEGRKRKRRTRKGKEKAEGLGRVSVECEGVWKQRKTKAERASVERKDREERRVRLCDRKQGKGRKWERRALKEE